MPQKQTIMWTALPNGVKSGGGVLQLSVFVSPRLQTDQGLPRPQLSQFPDFQGWTAKVQAVQFAVQFEGGRPIPAARVGPALEPDLWAALFKATTYVQPYQAEDFSSHLIYSHPVASVSAFLKSQYQMIGATSPLGLPARSVVSAQLAPISLYEPPAATPGGTAALHVVTPAITTQTGARPAQKTASPPGARQVAIPPTLQDLVRNLQPHVQPSATRNLNALLRQSALPVRPAAIEAFQSIYQDMQQYKAVRAGATLQPTRDFLQVRLNYPKLEIAITPLQPPDIDFHKMVSTLGNYPQLMRVLGLVIDLEVPIPSGVTSSTVKVLPTWAPDSPPSAFNTDFSAKTACTVDVAKGLFFTRPETSPSMIVNGLLNLSDETAYPVTNVDVPGSALKMTNLADRLASSSVLPTSAVGTPLEPMAFQRSAAHAAAAVSPKAGASATAPEEATAALPALRTSGISLAQANRAEWLAGVMAKAALNNQAVDANTPDQVTHYADDLVRGYRVDVWDSQSQSWHSLCQRKGTYNFFEGNVTRQYDDEGFAQLGVTQPIADPSAGSEPPKDLYLQESMFTWNGWSLTVPRPGKTIAPDGTAQGLDDPAVAVTRASSDFKMVASFAPQPGTLPRLRFGNTYRLRARVVDLAGNSLGPKAPDPADFSKATAPHPYTRFEPVVAPLVVMTRTFNASNSPGESLGRLVLRSNFDKSAQDYAPIYGNFVSDPAYTPFALRLIAPPKTSQAMAERHSMFDSPSGPMLKDQATYQMIASKAEGAFMIDPQTRLPIQSNLAVPYLPDPLCRGSALWLVNTINNVAATVPSVSFYPARGNWPNPVPFFLKVVEGTGNTSVQWDEPSRTLTVQIAKANVATVDLSSLLDDSNSGARNLQTMGVWNWIKEGAPANLAQLQQNAGGGRHWMLTPTRQLVLVHAVQQPLILPQFHLLTPNRQLAETFAYLADDQPMPIDGKSTLKVDFQAVWQEPLDDVNDPNGPRILNGSVHVHEWKLGVQDAAIEIKTSAALVQGSSSPAPPPAGLAPAPGLARQRAVAAPLAQQKVVATEEKTVTPTAKFPAVVWKPGTLIPADVRVARPSLPPQQKFGYSFRHDFGDTKYRKVNYSAVATTRFAEYFPITDPAQLTRTSPTAAVDVPSSARPPIPSVLYAVPTFGWQKQTQVQFDKGGVNLGPVTLPGVKGVGTISRRSGGGLRIYLDRPWYATGDGELLGVILWPSPTPMALSPIALKSGVAAGLPATVKVAPGVVSKSASASAARTAMMVQQVNAGAAVPDPLVKLVTQWGMDPIWKTNPLPQDLPRLDNFPNVVKSGAGLALEELADIPEPSPGAYQVGVAGFAPQYDKDRGLWYCDLEINFGESYFPFIRLALARYQPISVDDCHLSHVVQADIAQLAPDRAATVIYDPKNPKKLEVAVAGLSYAASAAGVGPSVMEVTVEAKPVGADGDLGWIPVPEATISFGAQPSGSATVWRGEVRLDRYKVPKLQELRLVIREYETFVADATGPQISIAALPTTQPARRLVYADVLSIPPLS